LNWIIIRTDFRKEHYVASQISALTFPAWVPCQLVASRPAIGRRVTAKASIAIRELPILPRRIFAAVPSWAVLQGELSHIRHLVAVECDGNSRPISVPPEQIAAFRAEIDRENTATLALATRQNRKQKAKWKSLHDALVDMIQTAKGQMERDATP
jgi:hypothetical protein